MGIAEKTPRVSAEKTPEETIIHQRQGVSKIKSR